MKQTTLLFLCKDDQILLALKKRGFGQGLWNGVGGKVEAGETVEAAAIRECQEEIGVTPQALTPSGRLAFYMQGKPEFSHDIHIFRCETWAGEPIETEEMRPQWFAAQDIPYKQMWVDDELWLPYFLAGRYITGEVTVDAKGALISAQIIPTEAHT